MRIRVSTFLTMGDVSFYEKLKKKLKKKRKMLRLSSNAKWTIVVANEVLFVFC